MRMQESSDSAPAARALDGEWAAMDRRIPVGGGVIMGILNVTPDSFSDGGAFCDPGAAVGRALSMAEEGAQVIDVGGESTRPGALPVSEEEELRRTIPVIKALAAQCPELIISIDTTKPGVARAALDAGARIINDISALAAPGMARLAAETGAGVALMHMKGTPRTMQANPFYEDAVAEVGAFLDSRCEFALSSGIAPERIVTDPGIGFGKRVEDNLALLAATPRFATAGFPVLLGFSRKSFIGKVLGEEGIAARFWPGVALCALGFRLGARIFRVHDIRPCAEALKMARAIHACQKDVATGPHSLNSESHEQRAPS